MSVSIFTSEFPEQSILIIIRKLRGEQIDIKDLIGACYQILGYGLHLMHVDTTLSPGAVKAFVVAGQQPNVNNNDRAHELEVIMKQSNKTRIPPWLVALVEEWLKNLLSGNRI